MNPQREILDFLAELKENNHKGWMDSNKKRYLEVKGYFEQLITELLKSMSSFDKEMAQINPKDCIFRMNRDIRFSADKTPYKTNFGAYMSKGGKKSSYAGYYLHFQGENESFLAGGKYTPAAAELALIRQEIDYNFEDFTKLITEKNFKKYFGELSGDKVKTTPKGYAKDNPAIEILKHKSFLAYHAMNDQQVCAEDIIAHSTQVFKAMKPLNDFMNHATGLE